MKQFVAGAGETAHHGTDRNPKRVSGLLVGHAVDRDEREHGPFIFVKPIHHFPHLAQADGGVEGVTPILGYRNDILAHGLNHARLAGMCPAVIDPGVLHDLVHPAVEPGSFAILIFPGQGFFQSVLNQIIAGIGRSRQGMSKPPEPGQQSAQFGAKSDVALTHAVQPDNERLGLIFSWPDEIFGSQQGAEKAIVPVMTWRSLILSVALACAAAQVPIAFAKPPEEEAAERAERAAERAAKAAERAADNADRIADRERDRNDRKSSGSDRDNDRNDKDGDKDNDADRDTRSSSVNDSDVQAIAIKAPEEEVKTENTSGSTSGGNGEVEQDQDGDDRSTESGSGTSGGSAEELASGALDDSGSNSGSNSGSGSSGSGSDDDDDEDHSGSDDDDDSDDDDNNRDNRAMYVALENDDAGNPFRDGELVVMSDDAALLNRAEALGFSVIESRPLESIGALVARLRRPEGVSSNEALAMLRTREPGSPSGYNYIYRATGNAPEEDRREPQPSSASPAKSTIKIGVIDGFSANTVSGWNVERLVDKPAKVGHGDAVTGILLRDLEAGYRVSPEKLMLLDVMREHPGGGAADVAALVFAFDKLVTAKVGVANLSLAGPDHPALRMAVTKSIQKGLVVVAAVGNGGPAAAPAFPAAYDGVVGVAAVDASGKPYIYSGRGPHVDIAALGVEVDTRVAGGELAGTSYAAPHVSALLASLSHGGKTPSLDRLLAEYAEDAGAPGRDPVYGVGILTPDKPARVAQASAGSPSR